MKKLVILASAVLLSVISCKQNKIDSSSKAIFGINEGDCRVWDGTEDLAHCRVLLRNNDLVTYYKNWSGTTNFHTLNWWVYRVRDMIESKSGIPVEEVHVDPAGVIDLGFDSKDILKEFNQIQRSSDLSCRAKIDTITERMSPYLFNNRELISDFLTSYVNSMTNADPMLSIALPLSNTLLSQNTQESFNMQLNSLVNTAAVVGMDQKACDQMASLGDNQGYNKVVSSFKLFEKLLKIFDFTGAFERGMKSWAKNQPSIDCRFSDTKGNRAYCQVLRDENYDLVFKLRRVSGLYASKTESVFQMYKTKPVSTTIGKKPMDVCAFEWKVDKYIRLTGGPKDAVCYDRQLETLAKTLDTLENDEGVCFSDHKNFDGFKLCSTFDHSWIGHDMNDEFSSVKIGEGYCVKVYSNVDYNKKPDPKKASEERVFGLMQSEKQIRDLKNLGWNDKVSSFKVGKIIDSSCVVSD